MNPVPGSAVETPTRPGAGSPRAPVVLVVDDEADLRDLLTLTLVRMGLDADSAESVARARELMASRAYSLCLTDMRLPDGSGLDLVREVHGRGGPKIAVITAFGSAENAVAALKAGAFDYLTKPVDLDQLRLLVRSALRGQLPGTKQEPEAAATQGALARLIGESESVSHLRAMITRLGQSMAPVSIFGESGSGKELVARAIHEASTRRDMPFIAVNCGAITENLMEAEFFGYRRGAFTGADRDRDGFFQAAAGGTLFLDEIAELPLGMQVKLLRAIQERRVRKVGATVEDPVDVRILCATHQELQKLIASGRFRQDLFYRLNVIELRVPSLRQRAEDIPMLAQFCVRRLATEYGHAAPRLHEDALAALGAYAFPGNVRELENILERAFTLCEGNTIRAADLRLPEAVPERRADAPATVAPVEFDPDAGVPLEQFLEAIERRALIRALDLERWNRTATARRLGMSFRQLRYRLKKLGID